MGRRLSMLLYFIFLVVGLAPGLSEAFELKLIPRLNSGIFLYQFEQKPHLSGSISNSGFKLNSIMPFIQGGLTLYIGRTYLDFYAQKAFAGEDRDTITITNSESSPSVSTTINSDIERQEYSVSTGVSITDNFTMFAGWRTSTTSFDLKYGSTFAGSMDRFEDKVDLDQRGLFIGGAGHLSIETQDRYIGLFTVNVAVGFLESVFVLKSSKMVTSEGQIIDSQGSLLEPDGDVTSDTMGINVAARWGGEIPKIEGFSYSVSADGYIYTYSPGGESSFDYAERAVRFGVGLLYLF